MAKPLAAVVAALLVATPSLALTPAEFKAGVVGAFEKYESPAGLDKTGQDAALLKLQAEVLYIQSGKDDDDVTYGKIVRGVARDLGVTEKARVDRAVALYLGRAKTRVIAATSEELAARKDIIDAIAARNAARLKRSRDKVTMVAKTQDVFNPTTDDLSAGRNGSGGFAAFGGVSKQVGTVVATRPEAAVAKPQEYIAASMISPSLPVVPKAPTPLAPAAVTSKPFSFADILPYLDLRRGLQVAAEAVGGVIQSAKKQLHRCYQFVKQALIDAGVIDAPNPQSVGSFGLRSGKAAYFNGDVVKNPRLLEKMGYRRVKGEEVGLSAQSMPPPGSILIYGAKCWFADYEDDGHAEIVVTPEEYEQARREKPGFAIPPLRETDLAACYYDCKPRALAQIRRYGKGENACLRVYVPVIK